MGALRKHRTMTVAEFLAWEERQDGRHEFHHGEIVAMVGGTVAHNQIAGNIYTALRSALRGTPCRVFQENMKTIADDSVFYPDVLVTCAKLNDQDRLASEPSVIVEVLSDSTATRDHLTKNTAYRTLPSLTQYVIVHQRAAAVESFRRDGDGWLHEVVSGEAGVLRLPALGVELPLAVIYEDTEVPFALDGESDDED
ncbi:Uma2 family endonuclease [Azospirillum agricola]|uniref:Uma2 family endonuclease n=1 Tax=Azospirillum agricola TaxID=1720247 RepID=UPI000A0F3F30|nr:Uma2 family endonuclease [Azospirillum agricola]SMH59717.1 Endonuclease, Uma2 family (restriction endonuclease fold) [Azospirillum lipoferum]